MTTSEESDFVEQTLIEWGLQEYVAAFSNEKIDKETFLTMPQDAVREMIPTLGPRLSFIRKRDRMNSDVHKLLCLDSTPLDVDARSNSTSSITSESSTVSCTSARNSDLDATVSRGQKLRSLLSKSISGRFLLTRPRLSSSDRNLLSGIIIEHLLTLNFKIAQEEFLFWRGEITSLFKYEEGGAYYVPFKGGKIKRVASGKLYDKYGNLKRRIKKAVLEKENDSAFDNRSSDDDNFNLNKLSNASLDDHEQIKSLWTQTHHCRDRGNEISTYYDRFPQLSVPVGSTLILMDYDRLSLSSVEFVVKWPIIVTNLIRLAKTKKLCAKVLESIADDVPPEIIGLRVLPYLFRPTLCKTGNKNTWKPSMQEQADGFILWINVLTDMQKILDARVNLLSSYNLRCQPVVIAVGPLEKLEAAFVIINEIKYSFSNLVSAVDFCFKSFYALSAKYPVGSEAIWQFLQLEVYEIPEKNKHFVSVQTVRSDLKDFQEGKPASDSD